MRIVIILLVLLLFILQIEVWRQWSRVDAMQTRIEEQRENNRELAARNAALASEVDELRARLDQADECPDDEADQRHDDPDLEPVDPVDA